MPCYYPIAAFQPLGSNALTFYKRGERPLFSDGPGKRLEIPCGQCRGCRVRRSLEWAQRCVHEAQMHRYNAYVTLTYNDEHLPADRNLRHRDYALFTKRVRQAIARKFKATTRAVKSRTHVKYENLLVENERELRFYMGGEYGETYGRPHYHALLFGLNFKDKKYHGKTKSGEKIYTSETLEKLWPHGYSSIGEVTFKSAAYIARYVLKKRTGDNLQHYEIIDPDSGEIYTQKKEYNCMSKRPAIGKTWLEKYRTDVTTTDKVITKDGRQLRPPRYYDKELKKFDRALWEATKTAREIEAIAHAADHTDARLAVQEEVANAKARHQTRNLK